MNAQNARVLFFRWLAKENPTLYNKAAQKFSGAATLGDLEGWADTLVSALATVGGAILAKKTADKQLDAQKAAAAADRATQLNSQLLSVNYQRAQAGLPPVDVNGNVIASAQLPQLPALANAVTPMSASPSFFDNLSPTVLIAGAGALAAIFFLWRKR